MSVVASSNRVSVVLRASASHWQSVQHPTNPVSNESGPGRGDDVAQAADDATELETTLNELNFRASAGITCESRTCDGQT